MPRNDRIFYACQAVAITPTGVDPAATHIVRGLQSVGMNSTFTLDQVFEIGQLELYENIEDVSDTEVSLEKVIDGEKLIFNLTSNGKCKTDLVGAAKSRCDVYVAIYDDGTANATGAVRNVCWNSGMYVSNVSYNYSVDGNATESVTLVGNDKFWNADTGGPATAYARWVAAGSPLATGFNTDTPASGVVRRVNFDVAGSTIPEIVNSQRGDLANSTHIQSISVSADFGQENILELGRLGPYAKFTAFPIEVTCEFEVIATSGDLKSVSGSNKNLGAGDSIVLRDTAGTVINLGSKNKLTAISYSGGDTGGGNATVTYSFSNYNNLTVLDGGA